MTGAPVEVGPSSTSSQASGGDEALVAALNVRAGMLGGAHSSLLPVVSLPQV